MISECWHEKPNRKSNSHCPPTLKVLSPSVREKWQCPEWDSFAFISASDRELSDFRWTSHCWFSLFPMQRNKKNQSVIQSTTVSEEVRWITGYKIRWSCMAKHTSLHFRCINSSEMNSTGVTQVVNRTMRWHTDHAEWCSSDVMTYPHPWLFFPAV